MSQADELSEQELYDLCSRFPFNAQCEGLDIPVPLDERAGFETYCWLDPGDAERFNRCKFALMGDRLTVYLEEGEPVELLGDRRGTQEIVIPFESVWAFHTWIWNQRAVQLALRGENEFTRLAIDDEEFSDVATEFAEVSDSDESVSATEDFSETMVLFAPPASADPSEAGPENRSRILKIIATDEFGAFLHQQLAAAVPEFRFSQAVASVSSPAAAEPAANVSAQVNQLLETKACIRCDLRGANLQDANLNNANLEGADLRGANLAEADLDGAYLVGANLSEADLTEADLDNARLVAATLVNANLQDAAVRNTLLMGANFQDANLNGADLSGVTTAQQANFSGASLQEAVLSNADLEGASFEGANLAMAVLRQRSPLLWVDEYRIISGNFFFTTNVRNADLSNANLTGAELQNVIFEGADLSNATLAEADPDDAELSGANLSNADLTGADLNDVDLSQTNLQGIVPADVDLSDTDLCGATLPDGSISEQEC